MGRQRLFRANVRKLELGPSDVVVHAVVSFEAAMLQGLFKFKEKVVVAVAIVRDESWRSSKRRSVWIIGDFLRSPGSSRDDSNFGLFWLL